MEKILFDNGIPKPTANVLIGHEVSYARKIGWHEMKNGELILKAEEDGYELIVTTGKNIRYQQNLAGRKIAIVVLGNSHGRKCACISNGSATPSIRPCPAATPK